MGIIEKLKKRWMCKEDIQLEGKGKVTLNRMEIRCHTTVGYFDSV